MRGLRRTSAHAPEGASASSARRTKRCRCRAYARMSRVQCCATVLCVAGLGCCLGAPSSGGVRSTGGGQAVTHSREERRGGVDGREDKSCIRAVSIVQRRELMMCHTGFCRVRGERHGSVKSMLLSRKFVLGLPRDSRLRIFLGFAAHVLHRCTGLLEVEGRQRFPGKRPVYLRLNCADCQMASH